jgi:Mrp family chromosome partitioning ATPase/capsular polysaccharide biosynthesis protein
VPNEVQASLEPSVFTAVRRYWVLVVALVLVGCGAGLGATEVIPKQYQATASIVISPLAAPVTPSQIAGGVSAAATTAYINQQTTLLQSPSVIDQAVRVVNQDLHRTGTKALTSKKLSSALTVTPPSKSTSNNSSKSTGSTTNTLVQVVLPGPAEAADAANAIVNAYLATWKSQLQALTATSLSSVQGQINSRTGDLAGVTAQLVALQARLGTSNAPNALEESLTAQQSNLNQQISSLEKTLGDVQVNSQTDLAAQPAVIAANPPSKPANDSKLRYGGIGLLAGLIVGVVLSYILALRGRRFEHPDDPHQLYDVPLLGEVPAFSFKGREPGDRQVALPVLTDTLHAEAEAYRSIATSVRLIREDAPSFAVLFTSAKPGAGKTTVVANAGLALAEMGERVLLIDADPVKSTLTSALVVDGSTTGPGLSEVLTGASIQDLAVPVSFGSHRLSLLRSGHKTIALQRWRRDQLAAVIDTARGGFDVILIDSPPLGPLSFATDLAAVVGNTIAVIQHHEGIRQNRAVFERLSNTRLWGYVYNRSPRRARGDYYDYYSGSSLSELTQNGRVTEESAQLDPLL